jgi:inosine/xanthosine triphosphatase
MKIIVASQNPIKITSALQGLQRMFPDQQFEAEGVSVPSGVSDQPSNDDETFTGARNRAHTAHVQYPGADYYVGLEGGIEAKGDDMESYAWVVIESADGQIGKAKTATFFLPPAVADLIRQGKELGEADDIVFGQTNSKQANGAVGLLTHNAATRASYYTEAVLFAAIPFKNPDLYQAA